MILLDYRELQAWLKLATDEKVPVGTLRYWASSENWTPHGEPRHRRWEIEQARATYLKYRGEAR